MKKELCKDCFLYTHAEVPYSGDLKAKIVLVGQSPGKEEVIARKPFIGRSGKLLDAILLSAGMARSDIFIANSLRCFEGNERYGVLEINKALTLCRENLVRAITIIKPDLIICLGVYAIKQILGMQKILANRGRFFDSAEFNCKVFVTVHPAFILRGAGKDYPNKPFALMSMKEKMLFQDFKLVQNFINTSTRKSVGPKVEYNECRPRMVSSAISKYGSIAIDFETTSLDHLTTNILSLGFCGEEHKAFTFPAAPISSIAKTIKAARLLEIKYSLLKYKGPKIVAARPFDETIFKTKFKKELPLPIYDVLTMAHLLDENYFEYSLESIANTYTDMRNIKDTAQGMRENLVKAPREILVKYNATDADATFRSYMVMRDLLAKDKRLENYYLKFITPIQDMLASVYLNGCLIDKHTLKINEAKALVELERLHTEAISLIPRDIQDRNKEALSLTRPDFISEVVFKGLGAKPNMFTEKTSKPSVKVEHLNHFKNLPFVGLYLKWKKLHKIYSSYIATLWENIRIDGRIYPSTLLTRTVTGRTVMLNPAIQTYPQRGEYASLIKEAIVADKGWILGLRDLAQSELRIMGWLAGDTNILDALNKGIDLHIRTAALINNIKISGVTKEMRQKAKGVNFGLVYGMSASGLRIYLVDTYNITITDDQAKKIRERFFSKPSGYFMLPIYYEKILAKLKTNGFVRTILGRLRRLPEIYDKDPAIAFRAGRQAINVMGQSFSSDLGMVGMYLFWREIYKNRKLSENIKPMWFIHDSIVFQAKRDYNKTAHLLLKECMEVKSKEYIKDNFGVVVGYPIESEGKSGSSWASLEKFDS